MLVIMFHHISMSGKLNEWYKPYAFMRDYGNRVQVESLIHILESNASFNLNIQDNVQASKVSSESESSRMVPSLYMFDKLKQNEELGT